MVEITLSQPSFSIVLLYSSIIAVVACAISPGLLLLSALFINSNIGRELNTKKDAVSFFASVFLIVFVIAIVIGIIPRQNGLDSITVYKVIAQTNLDSKIQLVLQDIRTMESKKIYLRKFLPANVTCVEFTEFIGKDRREYLKVSDRCK